MFLPRMTLFDLWYGAVHAIVFIFGVAVSCL
jgi:hypothetical protein